MNRRTSKLIRKVASRSALPQTAQRKLKRDWLLTPRNLRHLFRAQLEMML